MKQFRIVFANGKVTTWLNANEWTIADMQQFKKFGNYSIEWRN